MSESGKGKSGRMGEDTQARIDDLKGGWTVGAEAKQSLPPAPSPPSVPALNKKRPASPSLPSLPKARQKAKSIPPPPPPPKTPRSKSVSAPPPVPLQAKIRSGKATGEIPNIIVPEVSRDDEETLLQPKKEVIEEVEADLPLIPERTAKFDEVDEEAPTRVSQSNSPPKRGVTASLPIQERLPKPMANPAGQSEIATVSGKLPESIPRNTGLLGDIAYLFRVQGRRRAARAEMESLAIRITAAKERKHQKLVEMARSAIGDEAFDQTMVDRARTSLLEIEEKRSQHAGRIAAVDEKLGVLERSREEREGERKLEQSELSMQLDAIEAAMEPLKKQAAAAGKRASVLKRQLQSLDKEILAKQSTLVSTEGKADQASVDAEIASLRAERDAVASDEPAILADIGHVEPQLAKLRQRRSDVQDSISKLQDSKISDGQRIDEKMTALKAGRVVENRLVNEQADEKLARLLELGEEMHQKPPAEAESHTNALERQEVEVAALERRRLDLKQLLLGVERPAMIRGAIWLAASVTVLIGIVAVLLSL